MWWQAEFPQDEDIAYLNHAGVSPWPACSREAVTRFAEENVSRGATDYPRWLEAEQRLKARLAELINAPSPDSIALVKNTSEGLSVVAWGLDWQPGDEVVINGHEFPSNRIVWESLERLGVRVRDVSWSVGDPDPESRLIEAMGENTRLLAVSTVQYGTGERMDVARLIQACRARGVFCCVDGIQSLGALPFDVAELQPDFLVADGHKWLLGPEGLGFLYVRRELIDTMRLYQFGWHMVEHAGDYDRKDWAAASTARRFECGSPNMLGVQALSASVGLLLEVGLETVAENVLDNSRHLMDWVGGQPALELITPAAPDRHAGIVTFRAPGADPRALWKALLAEGIVVASRCGGVRFSPHFYTDPIRLEYACKQVLAALPHCRA